MRRHIIKIISLLALTTLATNCAREISSGVYSEAHVGETSFTYQGSIINARQIKVQAKERLEENAMGMGAGGIGGGLLGSTMGKGSGNIAATAIGAIAGAVAGTYAEKELKTQNAMEYVVRLTNNQIMTVVQGIDNPMPIGARVLVMVSNDGRSRIVPDSSPVQDIQAPIASPTVNIKKNR